MNESLVVITSFPAQRETHAPGVVGIASYAKNTLKALQKHLKHGSITVLAEKLPDNESRSKNQELSKKDKNHDSYFMLHNSYIDGGITVKRMWTRNSFMTFPNLFREIYRNHKTSPKVLIEFELAMYGNIFYLSLFPFFLVALKLMRKNVSLVIHQVIPDFAELSGHINMSDHGIQMALYNTAMSIFYRIILLLSDKVIVFEEVLKDRLKEFGNTRKIVVIPHGVENFDKIPTKTVARKSLRLKSDTFVVLSFGFLAWYKGTDWIIEAIARIPQSKIAGKKVHLILAGGPNPNHLDKDYYVKYVTDLERKAQGYGFTITGFVAESDIPLYFQASDFVVFPYRTLMSSSGPLSMAFSFKKPFMVSDAMRGMFKSRDIDEILQKIGLKRENLYYGENADFHKKVIRTIKNSEFRQKVGQLAGKIGQARNWDVIGARYYEELFS